MLCIATSLGPRQETLPSCSFPQSHTTAFHELFENATSEQNFIFLLFLKIVFLFILFFFFKTKKKVPGHQTHTWHLQIGCELYPWFYPELKSGLVT